MRARGDGLDWVACRPCAPARNAVALAFVLNGLCFATLVSRVPDLRADLRPRQRRARPAAAGDRRRLAAGAAGGGAADRPGWVRPGWSASGAWAAARGLVVAALAADVAASWPLCALGLFGYGIGVGVWDVAMNVEGAEVERRLGRTVMPRFHAGWSVGSIVGAGVGVLDGGRRRAAASSTWAASACWRSRCVVPGVRAFLPPAPQPETTGAGRRARPGWSRGRWRSGVMVLAFAMVEGSANDWLGARADRRLRRAPLGGRRRLLALRHRDDRRAGWSGRWCWTASAGRRCSWATSALAAARRAAGRAWRARRCSWPSASCSGASAPRSASRSA